MAALRALDTRDATGTRRRLRRREHRGGDGALAPRRRASAAPDRARLAARDGALAEARRCARACRARNDGAAGRGWPCPEWPDQNARPDLNPCALSPVHYGPHTGITPCFFRGRSTCLFADISR